METKNHELRPEYDTTTLRVRKMGPARRSFRGIPNPDYDPHYDYLYADKESQIPIRQVETGIDGKLASRQGDSENAPKHLQITPEEEAQAFGLLSFDSGDVVVSYLGDNDRLLKTVNDAGDAVYVHQRLGRLPHETAHDIVRWYTVFAGDTGTPQDAVDRGEKRLGEEGIVAVITE